MVIYQERYWTETDAEWTSAQQHDLKYILSLNANPDHYTLLIKKEYDDIYILYGYGFDMHTGKKVSQKKINSKKRNLSK